MKRRGFIDENGNQVVCLYGDKAKDARTGKMYDIIDLPEPKRRSEMMRLMEVSNQQSRRIAELEHERDKYKAALEQIAKEKDFYTSMNACMNRRPSNGPARDIAREALKGGE